MATCAQASTAVDGNQSLSRLKADSGTAKSCFRPSSTLPVSFHARTCRKARKFKSAADGSETGPPCVLARKRQATENGRTRRTWFWHALAKAPCQHFPAALH